jgi:1-acyl-sn-glycerol-3-phosphate acyltransferase
MSALSVLIKTFFFYVLGVFWVGFIAYLIPVPIALLERLLGRKETPLALTALHKGILITGLFYRLAADIRIDDAHRVPEGTAVVICNHHSYFDIYLLLHVFPRILFSARRSLFWIPFLGWAMALFGHFPHSDEDPGAALQKADESLRRGRYVGMFPEGTRDHADVVGPFQSGAFRLAQRTTQRIQPVVVVGTDRVWAKRQFWIRRLGPVWMKVLPPESVPASLGRHGLHERIEEICRKMLEEHERMDRQLLG